MMPDIMRPTVSTMPMHTPATVPSAHGSAIHALLPPSSCGHKEIKE
jgi:hypothetical protein